jgi:L-ascorbate metabolism protein UlaG (beta-lactamase superfamily)
MNMLSITISYLGLSCFRFEAKDHEETAFVTDPFSKESGLKLPRNLSADFVAVSSRTPLHNATDLVKPRSEKNKLKVISAPGEYEVKNVFINGLPLVTKDKNGKIVHENVIYNFLIGDVQISHLGNIVRSLSNEEIQTLGASDVLLLPLSSDPEFSATSPRGGVSGSAHERSEMGGKNGVTMKNLTDIIASVGPKIVIPMHYKMPDLKINLNPLEKFLKEMGQNKVEPLKKFKFSKKDLPQEEMKVMVLSRE